MDVSTPLSQKLSTPLVRVNNICLILWKADAPPCLSCSMLVLAGGSALGLHQPYSARVFHGQCVRGQRDARASSSYRCHEPGALPLFAEKSDR